jgi:branched-chain amino acid transport system substrate-binding protein
MRKTALLLCSALVAAATLTCVGAASAEERTVYIDGFGAKSGVVRSLGINSEAAMRAAVDLINSQGGVKLADGATGKIKFEYYDDRCVAEEGISIVRRMAAGPTLIGVGPSCSNVTEPLYGILQKKVGDATDSGLQFPVFTDVAIKIGLAKISEWSFRNVPSETEMYTTMYKWVKDTHPELKTLYAGVEENFSHSRASWYAVQKDAAPAAGFEVKGVTKWLVDDTNFAQQVREIKAANPDVLAVVAHSFTSCGLLKEMDRQHVKVKMLIGLTSTAIQETLTNCGKVAEGITIPTSFALVTPEAKAANERVAKYNGTLDIHSAGTYEAMFILKKLIEDQGVLAKPDTVQADRVKIRNGLAALKTTEGLLGTVDRTSDREAVKPYLYIAAKDSKWVVMHDMIKTKQAAN